MVLGFKLRQAMTIDKKNPFFPPGEDHTIWRYMRFTSFISLIENQALYFTRADKFEDCYEGLMSIPDADDIQKRFAGQRSSDDIESIISGRQSMQKEFYINCWHINNDESAAMWKLYANNSEGIAIKSSNKRLETVLDKSDAFARISMVQYADYTVDRVSRGNAFYPIVHKRHSFAHERELRAIIFAVDDENAKISVKNDLEGIHIDIDINTLIDRIYIAPLSKPWFVELVKKTVQRYKLDARVVRSSLYEIV